MTYTRAGLWGLAGMVVTGGVAGAQTNNPYPGSIGAGLLVGVRDFATVPDSAGAKARLNSAAVSPDGRFFVIDQRGPVHSISSLGAVTTYLDLSAAGLGLLNDNGERGVGQIAFHPQFNQVGEPGYGKLYASFSTNDLAPTPDFSVGGRVHDEVIYEFTTNDPSAATFTPAPGSSPRQVLRIAQPATNHNGGGLAFNPNAAAGTPDYGALYYSSGDGGGAGDPYAQGQNAGTPLAAILRIDPLGTNGVGGDHGIVADNLFASDGNGGTLAENYAIGLRNPQRFSWDRGGAKRMFIGDIGQGMVEEVDLGLNGANYGWPVREGSFTYVDTGHVSSSPAPDDPAYTRPLAEYDHGEGSAISGGFVYRGGAIAGLDGQYVFGDLVNGRIFYIDAAQTFGGGQDALLEMRLTEDGGLTEKSLLQLINETPGVGSSRADVRFGQDAAGNMYLLNKHDGIVRMLVAVPEPGMGLLIAGAALWMGRRRRI